MLEERVRLLERVGIFSGTDREVLKALAGVLRVIRFRQGQQIFGKGDEGHAMYIIYEGSVRVHDGSHVLSKLSSGQVFGEFALFDLETRSASVTAEEAVTLLELNQQDFSRVLADRIDVTKGVLRKVIRRIREMNELESKLAKSYLKISKQRDEIGNQHQSILSQKKELEAANEELTRLNEEKNRLIGVLAHGIRNPLTSSLCAADLADQESANLPEHIREYFSLIYNGLRRINSIVNQVLDIDMIELKRSKMHIEKVNLADMLRHLEESLKYTLHIKRLNLALDLEEIETDADRNIMYFIIDNLISNAIRFSPPDKNIRISLYRSDGKARLEVSDEGPGISNEALRTLFDRPCLHDRTTDKTGLSIVKKYTEAMDGEIYCESRGQKGTTFILILNISGISTYGRS